MLSCLNTLNPFRFFSTESRSSETALTSDQGKKNVYLDFCSIKYWELTDPNVLSNYAKELMDQFAESGVEQVTLAFAQLNNINELASLPSSVDPQKDLFGYILQASPKLLPSLATEAESHNIDLFLSFGGAASTLEQMTICKAGEQPEEMAKKMAALLDQYKFKGVDLDVEDGRAFINANQDSILSFLKTLNQELSASNKGLTLTTNAGYDVIDTLKSLFFDSTGTPQLFNYFSGLYLMTYDGGTHYYIDANSTDDPGVAWAVEKWLDTISPENAKKLHIGFEDAVPYETPSASAGKKYTINTSSRGKAAAEVYNQLLADLKKDNYPTELGASFWWPDEGGSFSSRYNVDTKGNTDFQLETVQAFFSSFLAQPL